MKFAKTGDLFKGERGVLIPSEIAHHSDFKSPVIPK
jgi:hypothetical protein